LGGILITAFSRSLVFRAKAAYMRSIDISADRSGPRDNRVCWRLSPKSRCTPAGLRSGQSKANV